MEDNEESSKNQRYKPWFFTDCEITGQYESKDKNHEIMLYPDFWSNADNRVCIILCIYAHLNIDGKSEKTSKM